MELHMCAHTHTQVPEHWWKLIKVCSLVNKIIPMVISWSDGVVELYKMPPLGATR